MSRVPAAVAAALLCLGAAVVTPSHAAEDNSGGFSCGLTGVADPATQQMIAVITGGPYFSDPGNPEVQVFVRCTVEAETQHGREVMAEARDPFVASSGASFTGPSLQVWSMAQALNYDIWLCTEITIYDPGSIPAYKVHQVDADNDPSNGAQCAKKDQQDGEFVYIYQMPPMQEGWDSCAYVDHNLPIVDIPDDVPWPDPLPDPVGAPQRVCSPL